MLKNYLTNLPISFACAFAALLAIFLGMPTADDLGLKSVPQEKILVYKAASFDLARRPESTDFITTMSEMKRGDFLENIQYHAEFLTHEEGLKNRFIFIPFLRSKVRLLTNGVPVARSEPNPYKGIGFGSEVLLSPIGSNIQPAGTNRIDFIVTGKPGGIPIREIYYGPLSAFERVASSFSRWSNSLKNISLAAGLLGLLAGLIGFAMNQNRPLHAGEMLLALGALCFSFNGNMFANSNTVLAFAALSLLVGSALLCLRAKPYASRGGAAIFGFAVVSLGAGVLAVIMAFSDMAPIGPLASAHFANLGFAPALLLGAPFLAARNIRGLMGRLAVARADIADRDILIEEQQEELREQIRKKAVMEERQRFVRDMHDGVGGQLLSLLMRVRGKRVDLEQVEQEIESGITDLRLVVDSLDQVGASLYAALATFRTRAQQQLDAADMVLSWLQEGDLNQQNYDTRHILSTYRIMQEALANSIRHAKPEVISIRIVADAVTGETEISVSDDGKGYDPKKKSGGCGISNMKDRAERLGATLSIETGKSEKGTTVSLVLPPASRSDG
ncbi:MAG: ATP-binding protein [Sphingorhabdus sp.]